VFAPEVAREIVAHTDECTFEHLGQIAERHAKTIIAKTRFANKILFCDTDLAITNSYCQFLFQKELKVPSWIEDANHCDFYLFLETDCPYVQDGTRLEETKRNMLSSEHKKNIKRLGIDYKIITGNWEERFQNACREINAFISKL
jgi:HTH-type transcriptional repressor of NAD biosynthesis genes